MRMTFSTLEIESFEIEIVVNHLVKWFTVARMKAAENAIR